MQIGYMNRPKSNVYDEINWAGKNGFDFIDLTYEPPYQDSYNVQEILDITKKWDLGLVGHTNPTLPAIYPIENIRKVAFAELKKALLFFHELGVKKINMHPFFYGTHLNLEEKFHANLSVIKNTFRITNKLGINLMLENYPNPFAGVESFKRILREVPDLKIHLDIGHLNIYGGMHQLEDYFREFNDKIIHLHIHDNKGEKDDHLPLGCGKIDWREVIKIIKKYKYDSTITLEVFCKNKDYLLLSRQMLIDLWNKS